VFQTIFPHRIFYPGVAVVDRVECWFFADIYHYLSLIIEGFSLELCQVMMQPSTTGDTGDGEYVPVEACALAKRDIDQVSGQAVGHL